jgi:hypothetical protein
LGRVTTWVRKDYYLGWEGLVPGLESKKIEKLRIEKYGANCNLKRENLSFIKNNA